MLPDEADTQPDSAGPMPTRSRERRGPFCLQGRRTEGVAWATACPTAVHRRRAKRARYWGVRNYAEAAALGIPEWLLQTQTAVAPSALGHRPEGSARAGRVDSRHCPVESPAGRSDEAWATKAAAAITRPRVFGWERRKGLNKLFNMGYRTMGHMGFTSVGDGVPTPIVGDLRAPCLPQK